MSEEERERSCADMSPRRQPVDERGFWPPDGGPEWPWPVLLKRLRLIRGLNQRRLAEKAGMVQSHVAKAESGSDIRLSTLERMVAAMDCRLSFRVRPITPFPLR